jgi:hypothetical protein
MKRGFQLRITVCRDKTGNLIASEEEILNRWAEYFEELLVVIQCNLRMLKLFFGPKLYIPVPTVAEVYGAIRRMKNNRVPGQDAITAELIKEGGRCLCGGIFTN